MVASRLGVGGRKEVGVLGYRGIQDEDQGGGGGGVAERAILVETWADEM